MATSEMNYNELSIQDTGWQTVNANLKYRVINGVVFVLCTVAQTSTNWINLGQLPANVKPVVDQYLCANSTSANHINFFIGSGNGVVQTFATVTGINGMFSYPLEY